MWAVHIYLYLLYIALYKNAKKKLFKINIAYKL